VTSLDFDLFDADHHYYEATDAFTRHLDPKMAKRGMQWAEIDGRTRLLVGGKVNRFIPNPQFDPVARPGCLDDYFRGKSSAADLRQAFGELEPIHPGYREPEPRIELLDAQGVEQCFLFPTLGVGMEEALVDDPEAAHASFEAFNRWLEDDWGFAHQDRILAAPYLCLLDPEAALAETERVLEAGARVIVMRAGPVKAPTGWRSPGDVVYDPVWSAIESAGVPVCYHSGESGYGFLVEAWGENPEFEAFRRTPLMGLLQGHRAIQDTIAALICHGVFHRFDGIRVATVESGSDWVGPLAASLTKLSKQNPAQFADDPIETLREKVWVSPYYEDDITALADVLGVERVLMGSDFPHAEGIAAPKDYIRDLEGFSDDDVKRIMRTNGVELATPQPR